MLQRGRKKVEAFLVDDGTVSVKVPAGLNKAEKKLFEELIGACDPRHFVKSDAPLLVSYVQATLKARDAAHAPEKIGLWERAVKTQVLVARALRLAPRTRIDGRKAGRLQAPLAGPAPWEE